MRIYELEARFDARKSFYGKAHIIDYENGTFELQSYNTNEVKNCFPLRQWQSGRAWKMEPNHNTPSERIS